MEDISESPGNKNVEVDDESTVGTKNRDDDAYGRDNTAVQYSIW
jgi:hypothetical protein